MLQLRVPMCQNNVATAKTQGSQIIFFFIKEVESVSSLLDSGLA